MMNRETIAEGNWLRLEKIGTWEFASRKKGSGAAFIPNVTMDNQCVFVEQFRPAVGNNAIEWPAGIIGDIEVDEDVVEGALRELMEETGYECARSTLVPYSVASTPGMVSESSHYVLAYGCTKTGVGGGVDGENIITHIVPFDHVMEWVERMANSGKIVGTSVFTGMYLLNMYERE
jgi:ADP-ribose pyrophosphatase